MGTLGLFVVGVCVGVVGGEGRHFLPILITMVFRFSCFVVCCEVKVMDVT